MEQKTLAELRQWFTRYAGEFKSGKPAQDTNILLKEAHTHRVCEEILYIGKEIGLSPPDLALAEAIALLHDVGRFEQFARYHTFNDRESANHAELGVGILREKAILNAVDGAERELILRAIAYHNRVALPSGESERCLLFSRMIRDADKLDVWGVFLDHFARKDSDQAVTHFLPDTPGFSEKICRQLIARSIVHYADITNLNDFKLLQLGWIYDLNFAPSFRRFRQRRYLERYRQFLPDSELIAGALAAADAYLVEKETRLSG